MRFAQYINVAVRRFLALKDTPSAYTGAAGKVVAEVNDNHHAHNVHTFAAPVETDRLTIEVLAVHGENSSAAVFQVRCMG